MPLVPVSSHLISSHLTSLLLRIIRACTADRLPLPLSLPSYCTHGCITPYSKDLPTWPLYYLLFIIIKNGIYIFYYFFEQNPPIY
jgi:hypothetical protein